MSYATPSSANFDSIFNSALDHYKNRTNQDLTSHPLLPALQPCNSPEAVLAVLREQIPSFSESRNPDDGLTKWLVPTVNVLLGFSAALGEGVGLVNIRTPLLEKFPLILLSQAFPPAKVIFAGVGVLLLVCILLDFCAMANRDT